jgi:hypothetical protein
MTAPAADRTSRPRALRARPVAWAAVAAAVVAAGLWIIRGDGEPSPGPLDSREVSSLGIGRWVGETFGYGLPIVFNRGNEVAVLDRIELVDPPAGLRVLETQVAGTRRRGSLASTVGPPEREIGDLHPVRGHRVPPIGTRDGDRGVELVFTLRADEPGRYAFTRIAVAYRVGSGRANTARSCATGWACASPRARSLAVAPAGLRAPSSAAAGRGIV